MRIPVISLWMPWANWVLIPWKLIETRRHARLASLVGKRVAIHATQHWDPMWLDLAGPYLTPQQICWTKELRERHRGTTMGSIVGTVDVLEHRKLTAEDSTKSLIDCGSVERYGLILSNPKIRTAIPCRGKQGIWYAEVPDEWML